MSPSATPPSRDGAMEVDGDLDMFVKVLHIDTARGDEMEVDGDARDGTLSLVDADLSGVYRVVRVNPNPNPKFRVLEMSGSGLC